MVANGDLAIGLLPRLADQVPTGFAVPKYRDAKTFTRCSGSVSPYRTAYDGPGS